MNSANIARSVLAWIAGLFLVNTGTGATAEDRMLFRFDQAQAAEQWQAVNDGVMGGRSEGRFAITDKNTMTFSGNLSLENNGGFASIRSRPDKLALQQGDRLVMRVRGDGREYACQLYVPTRMIAFSYRANFRTTKDQWVDVELPLAQFVATSFGRVVQNQPLNPAAVNGLGIFLGDKKPGPFKLEIEWIKVVDGKSQDTLRDVTCDATYPHHLQGVCADSDAIYWSFTTQLVKTDLQGSVLNKVAVANHHGDLCLRDRKLYVAVNLGQFNDPAGNANSWVYVYDADTLTELDRRETQEVFHGAGGIGSYHGHFYVVGGLPEKVEENYVYEYDAQFRFLKKHVIRSGHTHLGIQTAAFAHDRWWFGCYGEPKTLLVTDRDFNMLGRYEFDCSLGIAGLPEGRLLAASGKCDQEKGCMGRVRTALPDPRAGLRYEINAKETDDAK